MKDFLEFAKNRFSVRKYSDKPVEQEKIEKILEAARLAPTACNYQPQKIYVVTSKEKREALAEVCTCTFQAPVIFAVGYDAERSAKGMVCTGHDFGDTDAAIVCTHMMLEAHDLGLGSCWVGRFNSDQVAAALGIPADIRLRNLLPVGYPAEDAIPAPLHEKSRALEDIAQYL